MIDPQTNNNFIIYDLVMLLQKGPCVCPAGYRSDTATNECIDINECELTIDEKYRLTDRDLEHPITVCHESAICTNLIGSVKCECPEGLFGDGILSCDDFDECFQACFFKRKIIFSHHTLYLKIFYHFKAFSLKVILTILEPRSLIG